MKYLLVCCLSIMVSCNQETAPPPSKPIIIKDSSIIKKEAVNPYVPTDVSPMDMAYFPNDYPVKKMEKQAAAVPQARVIYSRPHRAGRKLFGSLVKWGQPWRLGANEATEAAFFQPVTVAGKKLDKGTYVMYAIPYEDRWTIAFNRNLYSWGLKFDPSGDVLRVEVPAITKPQVVEDFTMTFEKTDLGADLIMAWENMEVRLPIQF